MNKKLILISALLFSFNGWAVDIDGSMRCTIKDQIIIEIEDGVTTRYSGVEAKSKKGDSVLFTYEYDEQKSELQISLDSNPGDGFFISTYDTNTTATNEMTRKTMEKATGMNFPRRYFVYSPLKKTTDVFSMNEDSIRANSSIWNLDLERYFKNDWNGMFTEVLTNSTHIVAFDCRQKNNRLDELLEVLDDLAEENSK